MRLLPRRVRSIVLSGQAEGVEHNKPLAQTTIHQSGSLRRPGSDRSTYIYTVSTCCPLNSASTCRKAQANRRAGCLEEIVRSRAVGSTDGGARKLRQHE